ncbi:MAG: Hpt domain-containing protein [Terracidiphilus sp.]|nr:Hpt domain-containing protein [Terracidiphilus sp.]
MAPAKPTVLSEALDRLWIQFLPQMTERVSTLESAGSALAAGTLSVEQRAEANTAAHKLAGVLGTFGLTKGTVLAREAEILYSGEPDADQEDAARLTVIAAQLRTIVASKK